MQLILDFFPYTIAPMKKKKKRERKGKERVNNQQTSKTF